jgi:hypothetical protein
MHIRLFETNAFSINKKVIYAFNIFLLIKQLHEILNEYKFSMKEFIKNMTEKDCT